MTDAQISILLTAMKHMIQASEERLERGIATLDTKLSTRIEALDTKLSTRIDTLEQNMNSQFSTMAKETIEYASAGLDNHELRITALEEQKPMVL